MPRGTVKERIAGVLEDRGDPLCDDCLVAPANLKRRQQAYQACTALAKAGQVNRDRGRCADCGKTKNVTGAGEADPPRDRQASPPTGERTTDEAGGPETEEPWYWEGNVQAALISWLTGEDYQIRSVAHTAERETGKDIIAVDPDGDELWIEVKGYPESSPHTQARHWFSGALFSLILDRQGNPDVNLALAFPAGYCMIKGPR